jgi:hypothetical protein
VAKSRAKSRSTRSKARPRAARRGARTIELRPIRLNLERTLKRLRKEQKTPDVRKAMKRLRNCLGEIRAICGPTMMVPLA